MKAPLESHNIQNYLIERVSKLTGIPENDVSIHKAFNLLGLSSLDAIQIIDDVNRFLKSSHSPTVFYDYPNINLLVQFLVNPEIENETNQIAKKSYINEPIAIVGMACKFPGANDLDEYWDLLIKEKSAISKTSKDRWQDVPEDFKAYAGFIDRPNSFDNKIFDIYEKESKFLDPQQRKVLETSWRAIEHSGYSPQEVMGTKTGVYIGISTSDYSLAKASGGQSVDLYDGVGGAHSIAANRVSYFFDFKGPSWAVDTACSSSLVAISQAVGHLRSGECDMALAGGVNILYTSHLTQSFTKAGMLSPDGKCKTFSDDADGYVRGEGCGIVVLKRLKDALKDKDEVWGVVKGFSFNQDGRSNGLTAPNGKAQEKVLKDALSYSKLGPDQIDYIEAHGTGTPLGDPIEYQAIKNCFNSRNDILRVGSVKTNIGHLEAAAGIASIIKVLLGMKHNLIPKSLNFTKLNSRINSVDSKIKIATKAISWSGIKRAGISSFGFGGTNAHLVLESYNLKNKIKPFEISDSPAERLLLFSASSEVTLKEYVKKVLRKIENDENLDLDSFSYYQNRKISSLEFREGIIGNSRKDLIDKLDRIGDKVISAKKINEKSLCFAFTGQGAQYPEMERELSHHFELFSFYMKKIKSLFELRHKIDFSELNEDIYQTRNAQISLFCFEYALFNFLKSLGFNPTFFVGHSLGEVVAYICGEGVSLENGVDLIYYRGCAMQNSSAGAMTTLYTNEQTVRDIIARENIAIDIAVKNTPELTVVSGTVKEIERFESVLSNIKFKRLNVSQGFHSSLMDGVLDEFHNNIKHIEFKTSKVPVISSVNGKILHETNCEYWVSQIREPTDFIGVCRAISEYNIGKIIEVGPNATLSQLININLSNVESVYPTQQRGVSYGSFLKFLKNTFYDGMRLQTREVFSKRSYRYIDTVCTPFNDKEFSFSNTDPTKVTAFVERKKYTENEIENLIINIVSEQLEINFVQIDSDMPIINLGADSLLLLNVLDTIKDEFNVVITITDVFQELSTIRLISKHIFESLINLDVQRKPIEIKSEVKQSDAKTHKNSKGVLGNFSSDMNSQDFSEGVKQEFLEKLIQDFNFKTGKSKVWSGKFRKYLSDNRVSAGFRPNLKEMVYPIIWKRAEGAYFWDLDDNKFLDFTMGFGVNLFGHSPDFINDEIKKQLDQGMALGPQSQLAALVAEKFCKITDNERLTFLNSGTEAVMTAIRLIRAKTKREKVVIFEGSYHGHFDGILGRTNSRNETVPVAPGVSNSLVNSLVVLEYGSDEALDYLRKYGHELAGVVIEPVQSRYPELQPGTFLREIKTITSNSGAALVFDEVITGLRVGLKGAQGYFGVKANLSSYGKVLGGGMPIGAVAGEHEYLDFIDGGDWSFGDDSMPVNPLTFFAGTFCKHSLAMAASLAILTRIENNGEEIFDELNLKTKELASELNAFFLEKDISLRIVYFSSLFRFKFTGNMDLLFYLFNLNGIYVWEGRNLFLSTAHSHEDINEFISTTKDIVNSLIEIGYIKTGVESIETNKQSLGNHVKQVEQREFTFEHKRFQSMSMEGEAGAQASKITVGIELIGPIDIKKLQKAVEDIINRHDSLKCFYDLNKSKINFNTFNELKVIHIDFTEISEANELFEEFLLSEAKKTFDLSKNCIEVHIISLTKENTKLTFSGHHIALDGLSLAMLSFDIANTYSELVGLKKKNKIKETSFIDFLDNNKIQNEKIKDQKKYWLDQVSGYDRVLFSTKNYDGSRISIDLDLKLSKKMKFFGYKNKSSLMNTMMLGLIKTLQDCYSVYDIVIGVPIAGHVNITDTMVGNCVNILPFRMKSYVDENNEDFINRHKNYQLESFKHSQVSYHYLKEFFEREPIEIVLNVEPINELPKFGNLKADLITYPSHGSEYPIYLNVMKIDNKINLTMDFQLSAFENDSKATEFINKIILNLESIVGGK